MKFSSKVEKCGLSPMRKFHPYAVAAKARGVNIYHLNIGQPDVQTPPAFFEAVRHFEQPVLAYAPSPGIPELIDAIQNYYDKLDMHFDKSEIYVTAGGSEALQIALQCILDDGDEILIPEPFYPNYNTMTRTCGASIRPIPTCPEEGYRYAEREKIESLINEHTRAIMVTNPGNPTGVVLSHEEMEMLVDVAQKHDLFLIGDEAYREFVYGGEKLQSFGEFADRAGDNIIVIDTVSKRFSACGARIGCVITRNSDLYNNAMKWCQGRLCASTIDQVASAALYTVGPEYFDAVRKEYKARRDTLADEVELLGAGRDFDLDAVRHGKLSPVFFGSALTNFGVEPFLNAFLEMTTPPLPRVSDAGEVDVYSPEFSAFVFKIQANMNKAHRDRLAFMRICSGRFERDMEYFHVQSGRKMRLSQPQTMMAAEREIVDEAYAGDIIGVFDPDIFSIGDTITMPGKKFRFSGIPTFEPEHFMLVSPKDTMKRKQFVKGVEQIAQEGAIQIFKIPDSGFEDVVVGVVGTLQFDVFEYRMKNEYGVDLRMSGLPYEHLRLIRECPCDVKDLMLCSGSRVLEDFKGRKLIAFGGEWSVGFLTKHNEGLILDDWLSV